MLVLILRVTRLNFYLYICVCFFFFGVTESRLRPGGEGGGRGSGCDLGGEVVVVVVLVIVVSQNMGAAAAASSFALVLCSMGRFSPHWLERAEAKWSLCWFWARNLSLCLFLFFFGSLFRCFPEPPGYKKRRIVTSFNHSCLQLVFQKV